MSSLYGLSVKVSYGDVIVEVNGIPTESESHMDGQNGTFRDRRTFSPDDIRQIIETAIRESLSKVKA